MAITYICKKLGMSHSYENEATIIPITYIQVLKSKILKIIFYKELNRYYVSVGYNTKYETESTLLLKPKIFTSFFLTKDEIAYYNLKEGTIMPLKEDTISENVLLRGKTTGKGFAGNIKRNHFKRGPMSHGSKHHRLQGSLGASTDPSRVFPGKKMSGHLGNNTCTLANVKLISCNSQSRVCTVKGSIMGKKNTFLYLSLI